MARLALLAPWAAAARLAVLTLAITGAPTARAAASGPAPADDGACRRIATAASEGRLRSLATDHAEVGGQRVTFTVDSASGAPVPAWRLATSSGTWPADRAAPRFSDDEARYRDVMLVAPQGHPHLLLADRSGIPVRSLSLDPRHADCAFDVVMRDTVGPSSADVAFCRALLSSRVGGVGDTIRLDAPSQVDDPSLSIEGHVLVTGTGIADFMNVGTPLRLARVESREAADGPVTRRLVVLTADGRHRLEGRPAALLEAMQAPPEPATKMRLIDDHDRIVLEIAGDGSRFDPRTVHRVTAIDSLTVRHVCDFEHHADVGGQAVPRAAAP
jgi:hypothetical protein